MNQLPQELEDFILQYLNGDPASLKMSSLVCHRFAYTARKYLFSTIVLEFSSYGDPQTLPARFMHLLLSSPYICDFVQNLSIIDNRYKIGGPTHLRFDTILPTCLPLLRNLRRVAVESMTLTSLMWNAMSQDVQLALEETFRSPLLVSISFYRILDLPLALLSGCPSLQSLSLKLVTFRKEDMALKEGNSENRQPRLELDAEISPSPSQALSIKPERRPQLTSLLLMLSDPLFNFFATWVTNHLSPLDISRVRRLSVSMTMEYYDHGNVRTLLSATASSLEVFCFSPVFGGSSNTIAINPIDVSTLHHLRILRLRLGMIQTLFRNRAPTNFSPWVLKLIARLNSEHMEEISLKIDLAHQLRGRVPQGSQNNSDLESWAALDSALAENCPSLRNFTIYILQDWDLGSSTDLLDDDAAESEMRQLSSLRNQLSTLANRGVLHIKAAHSRMGFFGSEETSSVSPSDDIT